MCESDSCAAEVPGLLRGESISSEAEACGPAYFSSSPIEDSSLIGYGAATSGLGMRMVV